MLARDQIETQGLHILAEVERVCVQSLAQVEGEGAICPVIALFDLGLAAMIHACLRFTGVGEGGFDRTYASLVYGSSPAILNVTVILPSFFIPQLWSTYTTIIALKEAHRTSNFRATTAVLVPYGVLTLIALGFFMVWMADAYRNFMGQIPT